MPCPAGLRLLRPDYKVPCHQIPWIQEKDLIIALILNLVLQINIGYYFLIFIYCVLKFYTKILYQTYVLTIV